MILTDKLRGRIVERKIKFGEIASALGITYKTLYVKMQKGVFNSDEIEKLAKILDIDIKEYFFHEEKSTNQGGRQRWQVAKIK